MLARDLHGHLSSRAAVCRGMPFCPCYLRVDLRPGSRLVLPLCWPDTRTARDICPQPDRAKTSAARLPDRHPACRHRRAGPGRTVVPHRNAAHRQTRRRRTTRTLGKDDRAHQARLSITPAHRPAPGGNARCAYCPSPTTTHSKEKRLLSMSKPRRTLNRNA